MLVVLAGIGLGRAVGSWTRTDGRLHPNDLQALRLGMTHAEVAAVFGSKKPTIVEINAEGSGALVYGDGLGARIACDFVAGSLYAVRAERVVDPAPGSFAFGLFAAFTAYVLSQMDRGAP